MLNATRAIFRGQLSKLSLHKSNGDETYVIIIITAIANCACVTVTAVSSGTHILFEMTSPSSARWNSDVEDEIVLLKAEKSGSEYGACHPNVEDGGPTPLKVR